MNAPVNQTESMALAVAPRQQFDLSPQTFEQALTFSDYLAESDLVPKDFKGKPANCLIAMQWGAELGLKPLQAMQNLAIINGRPSLWGDAVIALVRGSPLCEWVIETDDGTTATCRVKRRGEPEQSRSFGMQDAQAAGLANKQGPWTQYPRRMRQMRARAFALRDVFPDVLRGLPVAEELMDTPAERFMGPADVVGAPPSPPAPPAEPQATYPQSDFDANKATWVKVMASGKVTPDAVIAKVNAANPKTPLSDEQKKQIHAMAPITDVDAKPVVKFADVAHALAHAADVDALAVAGDLIKSIDDEQQRGELEAIYARRRTDLTV